MIQVFLVCLTALLVKLGHWIYTQTNHRPCNGKLPPGSMGFPIIGETIFCWSQISRILPSICEGFILPSQIRFFERAFWVRHKFLVANRHFFCSEMSSPIAMEVPSMVMNKIKYFSIWLLSSIDLIKDALLSRQFGTSSWQLDTSLSSTCWLGVKLTLAQRHMREYRAKVSPATIQFPL